ncbi:hypothetical protein Tco_0607452, partial [Tanacetum coccineum]
MSDSSYFDTSDKGDLSDIEMILKAVDYEQPLQARSS